MTSVPLIYASIALGPADSNAQDVVNFRHLFKNKITQYRCAPSPRFGAGTNPWNVDSCRVCSLSGINRLLTPTFEEATDCRAHEVAQLVKTTDLPIVFYWSGGIDSTVMLSAAIKNFEQSLRDRIVVKMTAASYYENPRFFDRIIKNKIKYTTGPVVYQQSYIVHGHGADSVWSDMNSILLNQWSPGSIHLDPVTNPDQLIKWLTMRLGKNCAVWFYELIINNSSSAGVDLNNYDDFWWWWFFNYIYISKQIYSADSFATQDTDQFDLAQFNHHVIPWYINDHYQSWSIAARSTPFDGSLRSHKAAAKDYIFLLDKNPWYRDHKFKIDSSAIAQNTQVISWIDLDGNVGWEHSDSAQQFLNNNSVL